MLTIITALIASLGIFFIGRNFFEMGNGWSLTFAAISYAIFQAGLGYLVQRKVKRVMDKVQMILTEGQKKLQQKTQRWQMRPPSSIQAAQKEIAADTKVFVKEALIATEELKKFRLFVPMIDRQLASAQFQLNWMIKEFKVVDKLMPKIMLIDPTMCAMKMARLYMTDATTAEIKKIYDKSSRRLRYNQNVLLAATMSWIEVKRGDVDAAFKTLTQALKSSDNETLKRNHTELMNNRVAHFSNSGVGDQWYSLYLEEPKIRAQRQVRVYR